VSSYHQNHLTCSEFELKLKLTKLFLSELSRLKGQYLLHWINIIVKCKHCVVKNCRICRDCSFLN